ncbi:MAG: hypothetical protein WDO18_05500 [Acidobacteriota bacterium]
MTYAVFIDYGPDIEARSTSSGRPIAIICALLISRDKLVIAGPITDNSGGLIVYKRR